MATYTETAIITDTIANAPLRYPGQVISPDRVQRWTGRCADSLTRAPRDSLAVALSVGFEKSTERLGFQSSIQHKLVLREMVSLVSA